MTWQGGVGLISCQTLPPCTHPIIQLDTFGIIVAGLGIVPSELKQCPAMCRCLGWLLVALLAATCTPIVRGVSSQEALQEFLNGDAPAPSESPSSEERNSTVPSFVFFSIDGALMESAWQSGYTNFVRLVENRNPNGCRIPMTWFASKQGLGQGKCEVAQRIHAVGHELATHSVMHSKDVLNFTYEQMKADIQGVKDWLVNECGIPEDVVVGYRAPYFYVNNFTGQALAELGFLYDSSLPDKNYTQQAGRWDQGMDLVCNRDYRQCQGWPQWPVWEVPAYRLPGEDKRTDPAPSLELNLTVYQRLEADFNRKRGYGVPVSLATHGNYLTDAPEAVADMLDFIDWALDQNNTWVITYSQYIQYLQNPDIPMEELMSEYPCDKS
ncbi:hypothetical protein ABPG77_007313 [Micractinium sp. CCAP 211/92]